MKSKTFSQYQPVVSALQSDRSAIVFVWSVWLVMMLVAIVFHVKYGANIPRNEDWLLVPSLTGNEADLGQWLWAQANEHRIPLPRLMLLGILKATNGDFRATGFFNIISYAALAFATMLVARHLRGGRTSFADAFFPILLLHPGNYQNFAWSWLLSFDFPTVLICGVLLVLVVHPTLEKPAPSVFAGISVMSLPLSGANGLLYTPLLALWLIYSGLLKQDSDTKIIRKKYVSYMLIAFGFISLCIGILYFVDYESPSWVPPSPSIFAALITSAKFTALGLGPGVEKFWTPSTTVVSGFLLVTGTLAAMSAFRNSGVERHRALSIFLFICNGAAFALALGWGRAGLFNKWGYTRYTVLAVPPLIASYYTWELYGLYKIRSAVQTGLFILSLLILPFNTISGLSWRNWYSGAMDKVENDILSGIPISEIAERHGEVLAHWPDKTRLLEGMAMLKTAKMGPFAVGKKAPPVKFLSSDDIRNLYYPPGQTTKATDLFENARKGTIKWPVKPNWSLIKIKGNDLLIHAPPVGGGTQETILITPIEFGRHRIAGNAILTRKANFPVVLKFEIAPEDGTREAFLEKSLEPGENFRLDQYFEVEHKSDENTGESTYLIISCQMGKEATNNLHAEVTMNNVRIDSWN